MMSERRCATVFAHPGHELIVAGLMQRYRPHLLFLTRADSAGDSDREMLAQHGMEVLDLGDRTTFFGISEPEIFRWLLEEQVAPFLRLREKLLEWLQAVQPSLLFGDAFELSNIVHDIGRVLLDSAWREYRQQHECENYELPLASRTEPEPWNLHFQSFPRGSFETINLTDTEAGIKQSIVDWVKIQRAEAAAAEQYFSVKREVFRAVPPDRDYTVPPEGLRFHYDEWGALQVALGKYKQPLRFADHFVPLVRQLPLLAKVPDGVLTN
jgi:hypothetical protein